MQVHRYSDNLYRSFSSREGAVQAFNKFVEEHGDPSHNAETSTSCSSTSISKDAQLFHGNNAPWELDVQGLRFSTGWVDFCEALDIKLEDEIVFQHMGFFKFQFFIFRNGERVAVLDAQGDGIDRNPHLEMLDLLWVNVKSSIPGTLSLDILSECKSLLVTSYDLQYEPGHLLSFIYNTESEDEGDHFFSSFSDIPVQNDTASVDSKEFHRQELCVDSIPLRVPCVAFRMSRNHRKFDSFDLSPIGTMLSSVTTMVFVAEFVRVHDLCIRCVDVVGIVIGMQAAPARCFSVIHLPGDVCSNKVFHSSGSMEYGKEIELLASMDYRKGHMVFLYWALSQGVLIAWEEAESASSPEYSDICIDYFLVLEKGAVQAFNKFVENLPIHRTNA
nr:hypothetical protein Iba_chr11eCG12670 [Ipomoea batatas]